MAETGMGEHLRQIGDTRVSRRGFLAASGFTAMSAYLAACGGGGSAPALFMFNWADYVAEENIAGELMDLAARSQPAGEELEGVDDALAVGEDLVRRYEGLWAEVTRDETLFGEAGNIPAVTGAVGPRVLGKLSF